MAAACPTSKLHNSKYGSWNRQCIKDAGHEGDHSYDKGIIESILKFTDDKTGRIRQVNTIANTEQYLEMQKAQDMQSLVPILKKLAIADERFLDDGKTFFDQNTVVEK